MVIGIEANSKVTVSDCKNFRYIKALDILYIYIQCKNDKITCNLNTLGWDLCY